MHPIVSLKKVVKSFSGVVVLDRAQLEIEPAEVHALIGQNGAGKSTLIKVLTGVTKRDSGEITFDGKTSNINGPGEAQSCGIATIYQELNLIPLRSVTENVTMGYEPKRLGGFINWSAAHKRTQQILKGFGIEIEIREPLGSYSTAIQQLVAIARAVSLNAKLVIMDEPTSSLDAKEVGVLFDVVRRLKKSGVSVLYVTHFLDELYQICDRVTVMRDGMTVSTKPIHQTTKLGLIAEMLGRAIDDIQLAGRTDLGHRDVEKGEVLLEATDVATGPRLKRLNLSVRRGEIVGLGGLLGSGRTESARALFGMDHLISGVIALRGNNSAPTGARDAIRKGIGFVTEDRKAEGIIPDMSVRENLTLALLPRLTKYGQINAARERSIVEGFVKAFGIKITDIDQPIRQLSGGNQQKVMIARWLSLEPDVLILDEPTRGVDVGAKHEIQKIVRDYVGRGFGVILISSEFEELIEGADRIIVMQDGESVVELQNPGITEDMLVSAIAQHHEKRMAA